MHTAHRMNVPDLVAIQLAKLVQPMNWASMDNEGLANQLAGLAADYPFILNTGSRLPMFVHSRTYRLAWTRSLRPRPAADLNPADAARLGIRHGDEIELATPSGAIRVLANLTELGQPGVVHMYHGHAEADVNLLFDPDYLDPISGFPGFKALLCSVRRVERPPLEEGPRDADLARASGEADR